MRITTIVGHKLSTPDGALKLPNGPDGEQRYLLNAGQLIIDLANRIAELEARLRPPI